MQITNKNTIDVIRHSLENLRDKNLENISFDDKQKLIVRLCIMVYPFDDHKSIHITSNLPIMGDKFSLYNISMASPKL